MWLEQAIAYVEDDELVEVTPGAIRLRKRYLDSHERKRSERRSQDAAASSGRFRGAGEVDGAKRTRVRGVPHRGWGASRAITPCAFTLTSDELARSDLSCKAGEVYDALPALLSDHLGDDVTMAATGSCSKHSRQTPRFPRRAVRLARSAWARSRGHMLAEDRLHDLRMTFARRVATRLRRPEPLEMHVGNPLLVESPPQAAAWKSPVAGLRHRADIDQQPDPPPQRDQHVLDGATLVADSSRSGSFELRSAIDGPSPVRRRARATLVTEALIVRQRMQRY